MTRHSVADDQYGLLRRRLDEVARRVDEGTIPYQSTMDCLQLVAEGRFPTNGAHSFPVWKTLMVGGANTSELAKRLKDGGFVSDYARDIMRKPAFVTSPQASEMAFAKVKVRDLEFTQMPTTTQLFDRERLARFNLVRCEPEDGPHIYLADADQPRGTVYWIGHEPITASDGSPYLFRVKRYGDGERWLYTDYASPGSQWSLGLEIVFRLCK